MAWMTVLRLKGNFRGQDFMVTSSRPHVSAEQTVHPYFKIFSVLMNYGIGAVLIPFSKGPKPLPCLFGPVPRATRLTTFRRFRPCPLRPARKVKNVAFNRRTANRHATSSTTGAGAPSRGC